MSLHSLRPTVLNFDISYPSTYANYYWRSICRANLPNRYSALSQRPVTHAQTWASYSALYRFGRLSNQNNYSLFTCHCQLICTPTNRIKSNVNITLLFQINTTAVKLYYAKITILRSCVQMYVVSRSKATCYWIVCTSIEFTCHSGESCSKN